MENKSSRLKRIVYYVILCICVLAGIFLDQWTKYLAAVHLKGNGQGAYVLINKILQLNYVENRGAAWGIFQGKQMVFFVIGAVMLVLLVYVYRKIPHKKRYIPMRMTAVLFIMGAIGNMIDRAVHGYVIDFFEFAFIDFPVFNVADIYVTAGAAFMLIFGIFFYKDEDFEFMQKQAEVKDGREEL